MDNFERVVFIPGAKEIQNITKKYKLWWLNETVALNFKENNPYSPRWIKFWNIQENSELDYIY